MVNEAQPTQRRWRSRLAELLVVFTGVMGAFILNEWTSSRKDGERLRYYVEGILADLQADSSKLSDLTSNLGSNKDALMRFLLLPAKTEVSEDSLRKCLSIMATNESFQPQTVTFDALKYSGELTLISDLDIRKRIIVHYENYKGIQEVDQVAVRFWENILVPYLLGEVDMFSLKFLRPDEFRSDKFRNMLTGHLSMIQQKEKAYRSTLSGIDSLRSMVIHYRSMELE